ncbi:MAG TPA: hypothetical protein VK862_05090 [Afifellaceae bacterium]|nr:hypothetical protein [Afifellaceae bacterium]
MKILAIAAVAASLAAAPALAAPTVYFEDNFDGEDLAPEWEIVNPNPDSYLVEGGVLTMLAADKTPATFNEAENVLRLSKPIPAGDWTMTARIMFKPRTMGEMFRIGVTKDAETSLLASINMRGYNYALTETFVQGDKLSRGEATGFARSLFNIEDRDIEVRSGKFTDKIKAVQVRLEKSGRHYTAALRFESTDPGAEGAVNEDWLAVQKLTSLRAPGDAFTIIFGSNSNDYTPNTGEGLVEVVWVKIEVDE